MRLALLFLLVFFHTVSLRAETVADFCEGIENTTDLVECLNKYNEQTREKLSESFQTNFDALSEDDARLLKNAQQSWIQYRNSECDWEVQNEPTQSLKRVRELHCLIRMTSDRQKTIDLTNGDLQEQNKAQGVKPRWENVLYADHADLFWQTGQSITTDLNCDGQKEHTLLGVNIDDNSPNKFFVAFIESTNTGRPSPILLELPHSEINAEDQTQCGKDITISLSASSEQAEECAMSSIQIQNGACRSYTMSFIDEKFEFQDVSVMDEDKEEIKDQ